MDITDYKTIVEKSKNVENAAISVCVRMLEIESELLNITPYESINIISIKIHSTCITVDFMVDDGTNDVVYSKDIEPSFLSNSEWESLYVKGLTIAQKNKANHHKNENEPIEYVGPFACPSCSNRSMLHWKDALTITSLLYYCPYCGNKYSIDKELIR